MPWTLYRYILREMLWLLVLSTAVLVIIIGMAVAIKPLQDGLLGPLGLLKFVSFTIPTVVGFALPFSAAFAATLVFSRMVTDHEMTACRASGLGYHAILAPVLALGLVLTAGMFYMSNWVVPDFYKKAERLLEKDMLRLMVADISQGHAFKLRDMVLYADAVESVQVGSQIEAQPGIVPEQLIVLQGVAVGHLNRDGQLRSDTTAQRADVLVYRTLADSQRAGAAAAGDTWIKIRLINVMHYDATSTDNWTFSEQVNFQDIRLPSLFRNRPKFLSWNELRELTEHPERYDRVMLRRDSLIDVMAGQQIARLIASGVAPEASARGVILHGPSRNEHYVIRHAQAELTPMGVELTGLDDQPVRIDYFAGGRTAHRYEAARASIRVDSEHEEPSIRVEMYDATVHDARLADRQTQRSVLRLPWMRWPEPVRSKLAGLSSTQLLVKVRNEFSDVEPVYDHARALVHIIERLGFDIVGQMNQRAASAVSCTVILLLGAFLSLRMQGKMPLVVYFWAFLLAAVSVVIGRTGENLTSDPHTPLWIGMLTTWGGNLLILGVCSWTGWRLSRV